MEVGNVISQKIRSAIKAKLVDLGAYVDDELPDYIMVMVANKKDKQQMTEDLNLFLGNNTEKFTSWLHALLEKLQSITAEGKKEESQAQQELEEGAEEDVATEIITKVAAPTEEPELKLQAGDDFDDEIPSVDSKQAKVTLKVKEVKSVLKPRPDKRSSSREKSLATHTSKSNNSSKPKTVTFQSRTVISSRLGSRKKAPSSTVGAILKHDVEDDNDEYDPLRPAIGSVASVVRAPPRKSSVPTKLQANKSLLMRAVSDAQTSIEAAEKKSGRKRERDTKKPMRDRVGRRQKSSIQSRLGNRRHDDSGDDVRGRRGGNRSIELVSRSRREEKQRKADIIRRSVSPEVKGSKVSAAGSSPKDEDILDISIPDDQRLIQCSDDDEEEGEGGRLGNGIHGDRGDKRYIEQLAESGADQSEYEGDEAGAETERGSLQPTEAPQSPKFVVTLDGVDPHMLKQERYPTRQTGSGERSGRGVKRSIEDSSHEEEAFFEEESSMYEDYEDEESPAKKSKLPDKCKFWPGCKNGDSCTFYHPTTDCTNFPRCKFADKCLYIHPPCKFDANCTRPNCQFTHSSRRAPATPVAPPTVIVQPIKVPVYSIATGKASFSERPKAPLHPRQITCRFFPQCTNMNCPYNHPKPCRFGVSCNQKATCLFGHPDLPSKNQLSWNKTSSSLSPIESLS